MINFAATGLGRMVRSVKRKLTKIQYRPTWSTAASPRLV